MRILVVDGENASVSQMTEAWLRALSTPDVRVTSAGTRPATLSREAVRVMAEAGVDLGAHRAKPLSEVPTPNVVVSFEGQPAPAELVDVTREVWAVKPPNEGDLGDHRRARDALEQQVDGWLRRVDRRASLSVREAFALRDDVTFLNHGSFGATPRSVLAAQRRYQEELEAQPVAFMRALPSRVRRTATLAASFLRADPLDVVFVDNATTGVTAVLRAQRWQPGDIVYTTSHVYGAVRAALEQLRRRFGIDVVYGAVPFPVGGPDEVVDAVRRTMPERTRLAIFDHITSITGLVFPAAELVALCRDRGVPVLIDGAHVPGQVPVDLDALDADYWVGNLHKWAFTPKGCAVLRVRRDRQEALDPTVFSHEVGKGFAPAFDFQGTRDPSPWLATDAALQFIESLGGADRVRAHNMRLRREAGAMLCERLGVAAPAPAAMLGAMQTLPVPGAVEGTLAAATALNARLWEEHRIEAMFVPFHDRLWLRISCQVHNTLADYERLADVLFGYVSS